MLTKKQNIHKIATICILLIATEAKSQLGLDVSINYLSAFQTRQLQIADKPVTNNYTQGFTANSTLYYGFYQNTWQPFVRIGYKQIYTSGEWDQTLFTAISQKPYLAIGVRYLYQNFTLGMALEATNNLDKNRLRSQTHDLFRYTLNAELYYALSTKVEVIVSVGHVLYPAKDYYLIYNPAMQCTIGINYKIL